MNKDKGLDITAMMGPNDSIVPYVLAQVIYRPDGVIDQDNPPETLREWTYRNIPGAFFLSQKDLRDEFNHPDVTIRGPKSLTIGFVEVPRALYEDFKGAVSKVFPIHSISIRKEWNIVHHRDKGGWEQWTSLDQFVKARQPKSWFEKLFPA